LKDRYFELKNLIGAILLFSVIVWGCQKGDQSLGVNLLPGVKILDTRYHQDKSSITTSILTDTKIRVDGSLNNLLGSFNDPVFGRTDASFAAQFRIPGNPVFKVTAQLDSIILRMYYQKHYGDTLNTQTVNVYELNNSLNYNSIYLSSFNIKNLASTEPIGTGNFIPRFSADTTILQVISVPLKNSFGNYLLGLDSLKMTSNESFLNIFKGLYISSAPLNRRGTIVSLVSSKSMIVMYYHDATRDTLPPFPYYVTSNSANVSSYVHDYSLARFYPNLDKEVNSDTLIYIQPTGGIKSKILIPNLSSWKDSSNYIINKATLTFFADTILSDHRRYPMPGRLYLKVINDAGAEVFPKDSELSSDYYGGFYDNTTATYSFNITQHLQQLIKGLNSDGTALHNNGFFLEQAERNTSPERVVLKGHGSSRPVELNISYTRYK